MAQTVPVFPILRAASFELNRLDVCAEAQWAARMSSVHGMTNLSEQVNVVRGDKAPSHLACGLGDTLPPATLNLLAR